MAERIYLGSGKKAAEYDIVNASICIEDATPFFYQYKGKTYIKFSVAAKKAADQYGKTHSVYVDEFEPKEDKQPEAPTPTDADYSDPDIISEEDNPF